MSIYSQLSSLAWYWNRLRCMSAGEVGHRAHHQIMPRLQKFGLVNTSCVLSANPTQLAMILIDERAIPICKIFACGQRPYVL